MSTFANQADLQNTPIQELADQRLHLDDGILGLFASAPLDQPQPGTDAIIVIHGAMRNAGDYYRAVQAATPESHRPLIIAPQFLTEVDSPTHGLLTWETEAWKAGLGTVSSFTVMDHLLTTLRDIPQVTIIGNSAGGQFVNRYAAVAKDPGLPVRYIVANPSTYLYFDRLRPNGTGFAEHPDPKVNNWRYGFGGEVPDYVDLSPQESFEQYITREVVYLLGANDDDPNSPLLEIHPAAQAQGRTRRERGERYHAYLEHKAGHPVHHLVQVQGVGHDATALFASPEARPHLFSPRPATPSGRPRTASRPRRRGASVVGGPGEGGDQD